MMTEESSVPNCDLFLSFSLLSLSLPFPSLPFSFLSFYGARDQTLGHVHLGNVWFISKGLCFYLTNKLLI